MSTSLQPWHLLVVAVAGIINREQAAALEYLRAENAVLKEQLKGRGGRLRFTNDQRRRLATKAKALSRKALRSLDTVVTPVHGQNPSSVMLLAVHIGGEDRPLVGPP